jgi:hypothetical protein
LAAQSEVQDGADRLSPKPEARTLLGCMWLQLARAIGGDKWSRVWQNGKRWSEIGGGTHGGRSDKRYCCGTCKAAAHAKKKVRARRLYRSVATTDSPGEFNRNRMVQSHGRLRNGGSSIGGTIRRERMLL